jgi:uncharacterized protein
VKRLITAILVAPIRVYQRFISPAFPPRCRYYPTCSEYAAQSIRELGPLSGSIVAGYRLLRCTPFHRGGIDEISDRRLFRKTPARSGHDHQHLRVPQAPQPHRSSGTPDPT